MIRPYVPGWHPYDLEETKFAGWVTGFVDGDGCFYVSFATRGVCEANRPWMSHFIRPVFAVTQGISGIGSLDLLREFFGAGRVRRNRRHDNHREDVSNFEIIDISSLLKTVVAFFENNPLQTSKRHDFAKFAACVRLVAAGHHLELDGYRQILGLAESMNTRKPRTEVHDHLASWSAAREGCPSERK